jgi:hypothetical protein
LKKIYLKNFDLIKNIKLVKCHLITSHKGQK